MIPILTTLLHGLLICIPFTIFVLISFWGWPRLWLHSLPADIAELAGPKTPDEESATKWLLIPYLLILPGLSVLSAFVSATQLDLSILGAVIHIYLIWIIVHVYDFAVIDFAHSLIINPAKPPIKGTEGARGWKDMSFHFRALQKALVNSAIFVIPASVIVSFLT